MTSEVRRYSTGGPNSHQHRYKTYFYHHEHDKATIADYAIRLAKYAPVLSKGMDEMRHMRIMLEQLQGQSLIAIHEVCTGEVVGAVSIIPEFVEYTHILGHGIHTDFLLVKPGYSGACRKLLMDAKRIIKGWDAAWMTVSRPVSDTDITVRFIKL